VSILSTSLEQLQQWLSEPEGTNLEFKEAKNNFHFEKLVRYCVALANEGGGKIILGVTDLRPRRIVGTAAFAEPGRVELWGRSFSECLAAGWIKDLFLCTRHRIASVRSKRRVRRQSR